MNSRVHGLSADDAANIIFSRLSKDEVKYASDPARGQYRGFAALHDLMDTNMLFDNVASKPINSKHTDWCNSVMSKVTELIIGAHNE